MTEEDTLEVTEKRERGVLLKARGWNWPRIARELGYATGAMAQREILIELERRRREFRGLLDAAVELELEKLDAIENLMWGIIAYKHVIIQHGKVVLDPRTNELIPDKVPIMQATDRLLRIQDTRAKLLGLYAAFKVDMRVSDEVDQKIEALMAEMKGEIPVRELR